MAKRSESEPKIVEAAMAIAAEKGWHKATLAEIAARAGVGLADLYRLGGRPGILEAVTRQADAAVLAGEAPDLADSPRDRLFDVLMRRFDALRPHKAGLEAVMRGAGRDPLSLLCGASAFRRSMGWMLEAAGISADGLEGMVRVRALGALWLSLLPTWFKDDTEDQSRTMAALDVRLRRLEELVNSLPRPRRAAKTEA